MSTPDDNANRWLVVVPIFQTVLPEAFYNFTALFLRTARDLPAYKFDVMSAGRSILHMVMNQAAELVVSKGYDGLIMADDDCLPPPDAIVRLIRHAERGHDFVSAMGFMRNYPYTTTVGKYYAEGPTLIEETGECSAFHWIDNLPMKRRGLLEADFCGLPLAVLTRAGIERCAKPVFGTTGDDGGSMTHDVFLCRRLQAAGIKVYVDTAIECGHITAAPVITSVTREAARLAVRVNQKAEAAATVEQVPA
jgi:hypothetical protein